MMNNNRIGTLLLEGNDAVEFANSFFHPSAEEIARHDAKLNRINETISIRRYDDEFEADVEGLDFSFLDCEPTEEMLAVTVKLMLKMNDALFENGDTDVNMAQTRIDLANNNEFCSIETDDLFNMAA